MNKFSINRFALLMQKNLYENSKNFLKILAIFFGILFVMVISNRHQDYRALMMLPKMYQVGFVVLATLVAGTAFSNLRTKERSMSYLSLPATTLEKLLAELFVSTVVFFAIYVFSFYIFNFLMILFGQAVSVSFEVGFVDIFDQTTMSIYHYTLIGQSILLAGAATFMRRPMISTGFTLFVVVVIYLLYGLAFFHLFMDNDFHHVNLSPKGAYVITNNFTVKTDLPYTTNIVNMAKYLFDYALAPLMWIVAYLKLKEKQV